MIVKVGDYVFTHSEETGRVTCFQNRRVKLDRFCPNVRTRAELREYGSKLIDILENVPDEYLDLLDDEDLEDEDV